MVGVKLRHAPCETSRSSIPRGGRLGWAVPAYLYMDAAASRPGARKHALQYGRSADRRFMVGSGMWNMVWFWTGLWNIVWVLSVGSGMWNMQCVGTGVRNLVWDWVVEYNLCGMCGGWDVEYGLVWDWVVEYNLCGICGGWDVECGLGLGCGI